MLVVVVVVVVVVTTVVVVVLVVDVVVVLPSKHGDQALSPTCDPLYDGRTHGQNPGQVLSSRYQPFGTIVSQTHWHCSKHRLAVVVVVEVDVVVA